MWYIVDIIILGVISLCTFIGYKRGLIGVAFKILSFFIALIITCILTIPISNIIINNTEISTNIQNAIVKKFENKNVEVKDLEKEDINNTSQIVVDYLNKQTQEIKDSGIKAIAKQISETSIRAAVAIVLYILTKIILFFFRKFAECLAELPFIKQFNETGGIIYGLLKGLIIVYVLLAILSLIAPIVNNKSIFELINSSIIGSFIYNHNIILNILF